MLTDDDDDDDGSKPKDIPNCALQLSIVLSRFSWNLLRICRLGEMRGTGADCCWTDSLSSFKSISALLRSGRHHYTLLRPGTGERYKQRSSCSFLLANTHFRTYVGEEGGQKNLIHFCHLFQHIITCSMTQADVDGGNSPRKHLTGLLSLLNNRPGCFQYLKRTIPTDVCLWKPAL